MGVQASLPRLRRSLGAAATACCAMGLVIACESRGRELEVPKTCEVPEVPACLRKYAAAELDEEALVQLQSGLKACFSTDPKRLKQQATCLPVKMGNDVASGKAVVARYFCADVCPARGGVVLALDGRIDKATCCKMGAVPLIDGAFGTYRGCMPAVGNDAVRGRACP